MADEGSNLPLDAIIVARSSGMSALSGDKSSESLWVTKTDQTCACTLVAVIIDLTADNLICSRLAATTPRICQNKIVQESR